MKGAPAIDTPPYQQRYLSDLPKHSVGLRKRPEDFRVEEVPLYEPKGDGQHLYVEATKQGIPTSALIRRLQNELEMDYQEIGTAGRKDADAVTTQRVSLNLIQAEQVEKITLEDVDLNVLGRHRNKLQPGHLAGNRFRIRARHDQPDQLAGPVREALQRLASRGVPNYYGPQRFGRRGDTSKLGRAMVEDRLDDFFDHYLGRPDPNDPDRIRAARRAYEKGNLRQARERWPKDEQDRRQCLAVFLDRGPGTHGPAMGRISKSARNLFANAFQSELFNRLLTERLPRYMRLEPGDIAQRHDSGGQFVVEDLPREADRNRRFDISPTGLVPGTDSWFAEGDPGARERSLCQRYGATPDDFAPVSYLRTSGTRRRYRAELKEIKLETGKDDYGSYLEVGFQLPPGSYASVLLYEVFGVYPD